MLTGIWGKAREWHGRRLPKSLCGFAPLLERVTGGLLLLGCTFKHCNRHREKLLATRYFGAYLHFPWRGLQFSGICYTFCNTHPNVYFSQSVIFLKKIKLKHSLIFGQIVVSYNWKLVLLSKRKMKVTCEKTLSPGSCCCCCLRETAQSSNLPGPFYPCQDRTNTPCVFCYLHCPAAETKKRIEGCSANGFHRTAWLSCLAPKGSSSLHLRCALSSLSLGRSLPWKWPLSRRGRIIHSCQEMSNLGPLSPWEMLCHVNYTVHGNVWVGLN